MKKKNLIMLILIIAVIISVLSVTLCVITLTNKDQEENIIQDETNYQYKLTYSKDYIPGSQIEYFLYENGNIKIKTTSFCSTLNCTPKEGELEELSFSKKNLKLTYDYLKELLNDEKEITITDSEIEEDDKKKNILWYIEEKREELIPLEISNYEYKLELSKGNNYHLIYLEKNTIKIANLFYKNYDLYKTTTNIINFNKTNTKLLIEFIKKQFEDNETFNNIYYGSYPYKEKIMLDSIIENKESLLDNIDEIKNYLYTMKYEGMNCLTPSMSIYDDNSYEFYNTYTTDGSLPKPKLGTYNYDLTRLTKITNYKDLNDDPAGFFVLTNKDKVSYYLNINDPDLQAFLSTTNLNTSSFMCALEHE